MLTSDALFAAFCRHDFTKAGFSLIDNGPLLAISRDLAQLQRDLEGAVAEGEGRDRTNSDLIVQFVAEQVAAKLKRVDLEIIARMGAMGARGASHRGDPSELKPAED